MRADVLIVGQGLAGTLLGWELERAGISFVMADAGRPAASRVAAGIINPITGRRLVKTWGAGEFLPRARTTFREIESAWGVTCWRELRVRRLFADGRERRIFAGKQARGELAPFAGASDESGFWIEGAARVDLTAVLDAARARWQVRGGWREELIRPVNAVNDYAVVIDCSGLALRSRAAHAEHPADAFEFVPWEFSKGEILTLAVDGLAPDVVLNNGHWVLPIAPGVALAGATHEPGVIDPTPTAEGRTRLEASVRALVARPFAVTGHAAGVRVNLPDKRPVAGRHPVNSRLGVFNGLGAKGALFAPTLAQQWARHLANGTPFEAAVDVARFFDRHSSQAWSQ